MRIELPLAVLSGTAAILALVIGIELLPAGEDMAAPLLPGPAPVKLSDAAAPPAVALETLVATSLSRPLFNPDRKPDKIEQSTDTSAASSTPDLPRLAGILLSGDGRVAIFQSSADDPPVVADEGGSIAGWRVDHINPASVNLSGPGGKQTLEPVFDPNAKPSEPALPVAAPAAQEAAQPNMVTPRNPVSRQAFDPRRFQPNQRPPMPFRPNINRPNSPNVLRVAPQQPDNR